MKPQIFNVDKEMAWYAAGTTKPTTNISTVKVTTLKPKKR